MLDYKVEQGGNLQEPLTVYGASKGAELALNLGVNYDEIDHLVLMAPSAYNFFGLNMAEEDLGSWTYEGETLPYLSVMNATNEARQSFIETMTAGEPIAYADVYESMITNTDESELEATRIKVEEFKGDLLIFAGDDDQMWPSALMAEVISEYTVNEADVNIFENAGHVFYGNGTMEMPGYGVILMGGDEQNNEKTLQIYFEKLIQTVNRWHSENE
ncbi:acyl-CoA thioester hydrolase/BAAT C-terminal domain-containing protein [Aerococcaceae bacterium WGS1372]